MSSTLYAVALRAARLNAAGATPAGASNMYVTNSLVKVTFTPVYETGENVTKKDGQGRACLDITSADTLKRVDINSLEVCEDDPELMELLVGGSLLVDGADSIGWAFPEVGTDATPNGVSLEVWTRRYTDNEPDATFPYARWIFPRVKLRPTARTIEAANPLQGDFEGKAEQNAGWGNGPANDYEGGTLRCGQWVYDTAAPTASGTGYIATPVQT